MNDVHTHRNDVRTHRAPAGPLAAFGSRLGVGGLVIAAIALGGLINSYAPDMDARERPFVRAGAQGETVDVRTFDVKVLGVRGAKEISESRKIRKTTGVWVLVKVRAVAREEPTIIGQAALVDGRGREFAATGRISQPLVGGRSLQPGLPVEGEIIFEVPTDAADLSIRLASRPLDVRMDAMAEIPLGVDRPTVDGWRSDAEPAVVADEKVVQ